MNEATDSTPASEPDTDGAAVGADPSPEAAEAIQTLLRPKGGEGTPMSERVREAYDSLPGTEVSVDYPPAPMLLEPPRFHISPTKDLTVEIVVRTPDGLRISFEEALEYELDESGCPKDFDMEDVQGLWQQAVATMDARLSR